MAINPFGGQQRTPAPPGRPQARARARAFQAYQDSGYNPFVQRFFQRRFAGMQQPAPSAPQVGAPATQQPQGGGGQMFAGGSPDWLRQQEQARQAAEAKGLQTDLGGGGGISRGTPSGPTVGAGMVRPPEGNIGAFQDPKGYGGLQQSLRRQLLSRMRGSYA